MKREREKGGGREEIFLGDEMMGSPSVVFLLFCFRMSAEVYNKVPNTLETITRVAYAFS